MSKQAENMSAATDKGVLAVLREADAELDWDSEHGWSLHLQMGAARATVAELERRADDVLELLESLAPDHPRTAKLRAALARCGGAQ